MTKSIYHLPTNLIILLQQLQPTVQEANKLITCIYREIDFIKNITFHVLYTYVEYEIYPIGDVNNFSYILNLDAKVSQILKNNNKIPLVPKGLSKKQREVFKNTLNQGLYILKLSKYNNVIIENLINMTIENYLNTNTNVSILNNTFIRKMKIINI